MVSALIEDKELDCEVPANIPIGPLAPTSEK
jgi:hypothetical protein